MRKGKKRPKIVFAAANLVGRGSMTVKAFDVPSDWLQSLVKAKGGRTAALTNTEIERLRSEVKEWASKQPKRPQVKAGRAFVDTLIGKTAAPKSKIERDIVTPAIQQVFGIQQKGYGRK